MRNFVWVGVFCLLAEASGAQGAATGRVAYDKLSPGQQALFKAYVTDHGDEREPRLAWGDLPKGADTTFAGVTHGLETTLLVSGESALTLVTKVSAINGDLPQMPSAEQFNIGVQWKPEAYRALENIGYANRVGLGHTNEHGLSYHADSVGLHLLFGDQDPTRGHAHVDYRYGSISDMLGFGEGHFQPYNSDVRAIGPELDGAGRRIDNFERHSKWFAPIPGFIR